MKNLKRMMFPLVLGCVGLIVGCGDDTDDKDEAPADTTPAAVCNNDGTCDTGENFGNCSADCNGLCTGTADAAYSVGVVGDGAWGEAECSGKLATAGCQGAGLVGAGVACAGGADATTCAAITGCTWTGDTTGCLASTAAACGAHAADANACGAASCLWTGTQCVPPPSEDNCTAGGAIILANNGVTCTWDAASSSCGSPKTGADAASSAATSCGTGCLVDADPVACSVACMKGEDHLGASLTDGCLTCYAAVLGCTLSNCLTECAAISTQCDATCSADCNTALVGCGACRTTAGCDDVFSLCARGPSAD